MVDIDVMNIIDEYGSKVEIVSPELVTKTTKAFIQPLRYKDTSYINGVYADAGKIDKTSFLYIGKSDVRLDLYPINTVVRTDYDSYVLKKAQKVFIKDKIIYVWAILKLGVEEEYI